MEIIRHCLVCGKEFKACNTCQQNIPETLQWRRVVCCPSHFAYHIPIIMYHNGEYDKNKAKTELQNAIDTYGNIEFCDNVKGIVSEILSDEKFTIEIKQTNDTTNEAVETSTNDMSDEGVQSKPDSKTKKNKTKFVKN